MSISGIASTDITNLINTQSNTATGTTGAAASTASTASSTTGTAASTKSAFDTDTFMKLLLAELKNQDPLEPMKNSEMLGQMAQLNSLQQLTSIGSNIEIMKDYMETLLNISS